MADELDEEKGENEEGSVEKVPAKKSSKLIPIIVGVVVFAASAGGGYYFFGKKENKDQHEDTARASKVEAPKNAQERMHELTKLVYMVMPEMVINLRTTPNGRASLLKCVFVLLLQSEEEVKVVEAVKPQVLDSFQSHIRELNLDQLEGAAGIERLRQTLTERVNSIIAPLSVQKILIKEFLTQ